MRVCETERAKVLGFYRMDLGMVFSVISVMREGLHHLQVHFGLICWVKRLMSGESCLSLECEWTYAGVKYFDYCSEGYI